MARSFCPTSSPPARLSFQLTDFRGNARKELSRFSLDKIAVVWGPGRNARVRNVAGILWVDLERARDRVEAAQGPVDNHRTSQHNRARTGLGRAELNLYTIEAELSRRGIIE